MSGFKIKDYAQMGFYDIKSIRVKRKLTSEQIWIDKTLGILNGQETIDKACSDNSLTACHVKKAFLHHYLLAASFGNLSANIAVMKLKSF